MQTNVFFKCLSDETRLRCITILYKAGELCVCELTEVLCLSQPKISRHLAYLRQSGLVVDSRKGQWVYYRINPDLPEWATSLIDGALQAVEHTGLIRSDMERMHYLHQKNATKCC